jgi:hypothetical protein
MKKTIVLLLALLFFAACAGQKRTEDNSVKLEYKANSRGFYQMIRVENQTVFVTKSREGQPEVMKLSTNDGKDLQLMVQELDLVSLPNWKAPTDKRLFDGAASANLKITKQGKTVESPSFDHGYPPVAIEKIVNKMLSFVK